MSRHSYIAGGPTPTRVRPTPSMLALRRAREYTMKDVRRCLHSQSNGKTTTKCSEICSHARLRYLIQNPLRTLQSYQDEMMHCLENENPEAHYIEGIKHYFALHDPPRGLMHLRISASGNFKPGKYLLGLLKLVSGFHEEGMEILDTFGWKKNTAAVDKLWNQLKRSLRDVPILKKKSFGRNQILIMPPRSCDLKDLDKRCVKCFYYKEIEKFMQLVYIG